MKNSTDHNCASEAGTRKAEPEGQVASDPVRHLYVHIPFCARICPYCAFYKERLDRSQTARFCEAILGEIQEHLAQVRILPKTIFFGGGTPTALTTPQLE